MISIKVCHRHVCFFVLFVFKMRKLGFDKSIEFECGLLQFLELKVEQSESLRNLVRMVP